MCYNFTNLGGFVMDGNKFIAIYYFNNTNNYKSTLKSFFQKYNIELSYETNFGKLLSKILVIHPIMLVVDDIPNDFIKQFLQLFDIQSPFFVPCLCFLQDVDNVTLPYNCVCCGKNGYENILKTKICESLAYKKSPYSTSNFPITRFDIITRVLRNFCVNVKSCGSIFLKDCINQVIIDGCKACTLYNGVYSTVAAMHSTTVNNLERCMRTTITNAWSLYKNQQGEFARKLNNLIVFGEKPTVKEFIYYVANYVKDLETENKIQMMVNGTSCNIL